MVEETLRKILMEEISSVKPVAFRNLQVDRQNLNIKREYLPSLEISREFTASKSNIT